MEALFPQLEIFVNHKALTNDAVTVFWRTGKNQCPDNLSLQVKEVLRVNEFERESRLLEKIKVLIKPPHVDYRARKQGDLIHAHFENTERFLISVKNDEYVAHIFEKANLLFQLRYLFKYGRVREVGVAFKKFPIRGQIDLLEIDHEKKILYVKEMKTYSRKLVVREKHQEQVNSYAMIMAELIFGNWKTPFLKGSSSSSMSEDDDDVDASSSSSSSSSLLSKAKLERQEFLRRTAERVKKEDRTLLAEPLVSRLGLRTLEIKSKLRLKLKKTPELLMITRVYVPYLVPAPKRLSYITKYISVRFINAAVRNITKPMWNSLLAALVQNLNKNTHEAVTFPCDLDLLLEWTPPVMESEFSVSLFNNTNEIQVPKELSQVNFEEYERGDNEEEEEEEEKGGSKNSVVVCDRHHGGGVVRSNQTFINSKPDKLLLNLYYILLISKTRLLLLPR
ncbi:hypothetical protein CAPTEDRAFT_187514 [Capitella teleta]|uniref:Uncharacterized protein n=1 Tax=Capitella teleta TaxID=283909 RepID=R7TW12_CAPTE|nr:hypothetical protein CAPTEDRAFT_187514 [Capitella teleta]|eukprot:ELT95185.1 hypothetical protein CAPTEDRAFT_187514 [Capitella teleta]